MGPALGKIAVRGALPTALLGAAGAAWYQFLKRPLPKTSGRLFVSGLESGVDILRDRYGVPHIRARSEADMIFALGFCHGQDRLWQLEFFRRATSGRLSEFAGPQYPRGHPIATAPGMPYIGEGTDLMAQIARVRETLGLPLPATGSNNWVVSADRTTTGAPLLACDPHLTFTAPDLWYEADLAC